MTYRRFRDVFPSQAWLFTDLAAFRLVVLDD